MNPLEGPQEVSSSWASPRHPFFFFFFSFVFFFLFFFFFFRQGNRRRTAQAIAMCSRLHIPSVLAVINVPVPAARGGHIAWSLAEKGPWPAVSLMACTVQRGIVTAAVLGAPVCEQRHQRLAG